MEKFKKISFALLRTILESLAIAIGGFGALLLIGFISIGFEKLLDMVPNVVLGGIIILIFTIALVIIFVDRFITNYERNK